MADLGIDLPKQEGKDFTNKLYSIFGYSIRGSSHIAAQTPCQDFNDFEFLQDCKVVIACIADGVGSCPLSHWGASVAVKTAMSFVKEKVFQISRGKPLVVFEHLEEIPVILREAFQKSSDAVEDFAAENNRPVSAFFSTLTFALYDGEALCCEHAGDDGVVAQFMDGSVEMVTERIKGEEASSVYPLQSGSNVWKYSECGLDERGPVVAFTMVTDGILDKFVFEDEIYKQTAGCCSGVYYPFMAPMVYGDSRVGMDAQHSNQKMQYFLQKMNSESYRKQITDDLTLVSVVNVELIKKSIRPEFDSKAFSNASKTLREQQRKSLYGPGAINESKHEEESEANESLQQKEKKRNEGESEPPINRHHNKLVVEDYRRHKRIIKYIKKNEFVLLGMAFAILIICILIGMRCLKKNNSEPILPEVEVTASPSVSEDSEGAQETNENPVNNSGESETQDSSEKSTADDTSNPDSLSETDQSDEFQKEMQTAPEQSA